MRISGGRWGWIAAVGAWGAGCIPEPVLRPRDGGASAELSAVRDAAPEDVSPMDVVGAPDVVATEAGGLDASATDAGEDALDVAASDVVMDAGRCDPGFVLRGGSCVAVTAARPMWPLSTQTATHRRPMFRWRLGAEADGARVEVCRDRVCATPVASFVASGTTAQPAEDLPPGPVFWRVWARAGTAEALRPSATWEVYIPWRSGSVNTAQRDTVDVNGDGYADIVVGVPERREVRVYFGSATGPRPAVTMTDPAIDPMAMVLARGGDANGDGRTDMIVSASSGTWRLFYGTATGFTAITSTPIFAPSALDAGTPVGSFVGGVGDVNGDGFTDVYGMLVYSLSSSLIGLHLGSDAGPTPSAVPPATRASFSYPSAIGDLDQDGSEDVVVISGAAVDAGQPRSVAFRGGPDISSWTPLGELPPTPLTSLLPTGRIDFNGDGLPDVMYRPAFAADRVPLIYGSTGSFDPMVTTIGTLGERTSNYCVTDFNGDGYEDFVIAPPGAGEVRIHPGGQSGISTLAAFRITYQPGSSELDLSCHGDINGDGAGDIIGTSSTLDSHSLFFIPGGSATSQVAPSVYFDQLRRSSPTVHLLALP